MLANIIFLEISMRKDNHTFAFVYGLRFLYI